MGHNWGKPKPGYRPIKAVQDLMSGRPEDAAEDAALLGLEGKILHCRMMREEWLARPAERARDKAEAERLRELAREHRNGAVEHLSSASTALKMADEADSQAAEIMRQLEYTKTSATG